MWVAYYFYPNPKHEPIVRSILSKIPDKYELIAVDEEDYMGKLKKRLGIPTDTSSTLVITKDGDLQTFWRLDNER